MFLAVVALVFAAPRTEGNLVIDGVPEIPADVVERTNQYNNVRGATLNGWHPDGRSVLITTRFGETTQAHLVNGPGADRKQLTFYPEPVAGASFDPRGNGSSILVSRDVGGAERWQYYRYDLDTATTTLLTDGASQNESATWSNGGGKIAFASTRRNKQDYDIYTMDTQDPASATLVLEVQGRWSPIEWSPANDKLLLMQYISATEATLHLLDLQSKVLTELNPSDQPITYAAAMFGKSADTVLWASDEGTEFTQLISYNVPTGAKTPVSNLSWNVEGLTRSLDGKQLAFAVNEAGRSALYLAPLDKPTKTKRVELPPGVLSSYAFDPSGKRLAYSMSTAQTTSDVYVLDLKTNRTTRWTESEVGGINPARFVVPEIVTVKSFDGLDVPAYVYRPKNPKGKVPVILSIHGGPEGQSRDTLVSTWQYWVNELGAAVIAPNVRGSTGYGRTYLGLDNGKLRENSVKDIGAILDWIATQPDLDKDRVAVTGGSYGGYMVLASMVHYADRLRCGIDSVGISNFVTFLENTEAYRRDLRRVEYGDERIPEMREFLQSISPLTNAGKIVDPLFVVQGKNDPRVPMSEAEQVVSTVRNNGGTVWYLLANDEGHGFKRKSNRDYLSYAMTMFLREHLLLAP